MKALYDLSAPAKVNLFLHVVGRRADGYHLLQSVFVLIDWADTLHFERSGVNGLIAVSKTEVRVTAELGFLLGMMKPQTEAEIESQLDKNFG